MRWLCECRVSLSCDMSPLSLTATGGRSGCVSVVCRLSCLSLTATGGRSGCVSVVCRCHVTCLLSLSYSYWWPEWLCECRVSLSYDMSPLSPSGCVSVWWLLQLLVAVCECRVSLSCDMSPLSLTATGGRSGCVSVVCRCHVTCLLSLLQLLAGVAV